MNTNKLSLIILILCFSINGIAQQLKLNWMDQIGGPGWDVLSGMTLTSDGKLVVAGSFYESITLKDKTYQSMGSRDCFIAVYNTDGSIDKSITIGGKGYEYIKKIAVTETDGICAVIKFERDITVGEKQTVGPGLNNYLIASFDNSLNLLNQDIISCDQEFDITGLGKSNNNEFAFTGWFSGILNCENKTLESPNDVNFFQGKIARNGKINWIKQYETTGQDKAMTLKPDADGGTWVAGTTAKGNFDGAGKARELPQNMKHLFVAASNAEGKVGSLTYPVYGNDIEPVDVLKADNVIWILANFSFSGSINGDELISKGMGDIVLIRYDLTTTKTLYYQLGGYGNDMASGMVKSGSQIIVTGWFSYELSANGQAVKPSPLGPDVFIATFNDDCVPQALTSLKGDKIEFPGNIIANESGIFIGGEFNGTISSTTTEFKSRGDEDIFVAFIENCNASNPLTIVANPVNPNDLSKGWELNAGDGYKSYSWEKDAAQSQYYTVTKPGIYTVKVISYGGCEYTSSFEVAGTKSAHLPDDLILEHGFRLYPTITQGIVNWQPATDWLQREAEVYVTDMAGKTILSSKIKNLGDSYYSIDLTGRPEGAYVVHVRGDNFHETSKIVIKK